MTVTLNNNCFSEILIDSIFCAVRNAFLCTGVALTKKVKHLQVIIVACFQFFFAAVGSAVITLAVVFISCIYSVCCLLSFLRFCVYYLCLSLAKLRTYMRYVDERIVSECWEV